MTSTNQQALSDYVYHELTDRVAQLESQPRDAYWPQRQSVVVTGAVSGHGQWDGREALQLELDFTYDAIEIDSVRGLPVELLALRDRIDSKFDQDGAVDSARQLSQGFSLRLTGDAVGQVQSIDGSEDVAITVQLAPGLQQEINRAFKGAVVLRPNQSLESVTGNGLYIRNIPGGLGPRDQGVLWNAYDPVQDIRSQLFIGQTRGQVFVRSQIGDQSQGWDQVWTRSQLDPSGFADKTATFSTAHQTQDFRNPSTASVMTWNADTLHAPSGSGTYFEFNSTGSHRALVEGNTIHRWSVSEDDRVRLHVSRHGQAFEEMEFFTTRNFNPHTKVDRTYPVFNRHLSVFTAERKGPQSILEAGWDQEHPHWTATLEEDGSFALNARSLDGQRRHRLMRWSSALAGGRNELDLYANIMQIGIGRQSTIYGTHIDNWGTVSTTKYIGWGRHDSMVTYVDKESKRLSHVGGFWARDSVGSARVFASWDSGVDGSISCDNWFRSSGNSGWMNSTYGGGWYMTDHRYIRALSDKRVVASGFAVTYNGVDRASVSTLEFNGYLRPIQFFSINEQAIDYGFDIADLREKYPQAFETLDGYTATSVNAVGAILSTQINHQADQIAALQARCDRLETQLAQLLTALGETPDSN